MKRDGALQSGIKALWLALLLINTSIKHNVCKNNPLHPY